MSIIPEGLTDCSLFMGMTRVKSDQVLQNFITEMTGYEYFKKQNDWVLKKIPLMITMRHFVTSKYYPARCTCTTATSSDSEEEEFYGFSLCHQNEACTIEM